MHSIDAHGIKVYKYEKKFDYLSFLKIRWREICVKNCAFSSFYGNIFLKIWEMALATTHFFAWNNSFENIWPVIKQHMIGFPLPIALYRALNSEHFFTLFQGTQQCFSLCLNIEELKSSWDILCLDHVRGMSPWVIQAIKTIVFRFWIFARVYASTQSEETKTPD